jgi:hypothetical protein
VFFIQIGMALGPDILKKINRKFEPRSTIQLKYRSYDLVLKTDDDGNAIMLFMGKLDADGVVRGERYTRVLKFNSDGSVLKDHWDRKGRTT